MEPGAHYKFEILTGDGRLLLRQFGCGGCHEIPDVAAAKGKVGPPLAGVANRVYLGGVLPNTPENMLRFIRAQLAPDGALVDSLAFGAQSANVSQGRYPDGQAPPFQSMLTPTPRRPNVYP